MKIGELMTAPAIHIEPEESVEVAARTLERYNIGALPVCKEDGSVCGVEINLWDFEKGDKVDPDDEVLIEYYVYEEPSPPFILPMIVKLPKMVIQESFHIKVGAVPTMYSGL